MKRKLSPRQMAAMLRGMPELGMAQKGIKLNIETNIETAKWQYIDDGECYALGQLVYTECALSPSCQSLIIIAPKEYFNSDATVNFNGKVGPYTAKTAPVIFQNGIGGYSEARPVCDPKMSAEYLKEGFVFVSVGARGRGTKQNGKNIGKAPMGLVDLKTAIRFLKHHAGILPGDYSKIISTGWSAGGAMSALLGVTANEAQYEPYLKENGAFMNESDSPFSAMVYCPITDLERGDMAYEWAFLKEKKHPKGHSVATAEALAGEYEKYINSLNLKDGDGNLLTLNNRQGSYYDYLSECLTQSLNKFLSKENNPEKHIKRLKWVKFQGQKAQNFTYDEMVQNGYHTRMKMMPAFDDYGLNSMENELFGTENVARQHFSVSLKSILNGDITGEGAESVKNPTAFASENAVKMMNPMAHTENAKMCKNFRIRVGTLDSDTSLTVALNLALALKTRTGANVDFQYVWNRPHSPADYRGEFVAYVNEICKN